MATIVTRAGKGSPLTHSEVDANFTNLNSDKYQSGDSPTFNAVTVTGTLALNADPSTALQAATKQYVDTIAAAGLHYHDPVRVETDGTLPATYDNGSSGVGATLTNSGTQAALVIDGVTLSVNDRVLIYARTNAFENGVYYVSDTGSASTNWVLTRTTDTDSYGASDPDALGQGDAFFVLEGATGAGELYVMNTQGEITFGTTGITFTQVAATAVYSAGTGLTLTGTVFSADQDIATSASPTFSGLTLNGSATSTGNITASNFVTTGTVDGRDVSVDGAKLDGIEAGATADQTAAEILTAIKTVDGAGSGLDADTLDGIQASSFLQGNQTITLSGDATGSGTTSIVVTVADDSHNHIISNVDGLQTALDAKLNLSGGTVTGTLNAATFNATSTTNGGFQGIDADTATTPSFTWSADLNTGIYRPAADTLSVTTAGSQRFTVGPAGQIGVGGASYGSSGQVLTSNGTGSAPSWQNAGGGIGIGQSWQTVSRTHGTTYQNTTGKPIQLFFYANEGSVTQTNVEISANNSTWVFVAQGYRASSVSIERGGSPIVPPNHYYRATGTGSGYIEAELR